jgi:hypothetical protein
MKSFAASMTGAKNRGLTPLVHSATPELLQLLILTSSKCLGHSDQIGERTGLHFSHDLSAMNFDRDLAGAQFGGNLFIKKPGDYPLHYLPFTRRQRGIQIVEPLGLGFLSANGPGMLDRLLNRIQ